MDANGYIGLGGREPSSGYKLNVESTEVVTLKTGKIGINKSPDVSYPLDLSGQGRIYNSYNNHLILDFQGGYYAAAIRPANNNTCYPGSSNKAFNKVYAYSYPSVSDGRQKENIREIKKPLDKILSIRGVKYDIKKEFAYTDEMAADPIAAAHLEEERKDYFGFIAQELYEEIPELTNYDDSTDVYTVNYIEVIPLLVEAVKEQQQLIEELEADIKENKSATETVPDLQESKTALLQNRPNPFSENTLIEYSLAEGVTSATLYIYDMNGTQLRSIPLHQRGEGSVEINGGELKAGMYRYSMIADGQVMDTKTMVLTD